MKAVCTLCRLAVIACVGLISAPLAIAHSYAVLEKASPGPNTVLEASPESLCIEFSGPVEPELSWIKLAKTGASEIPVQSLVSADGRTVCADLLQLVQSSYDVDWSVVGLDGHRTRGRYTFQVR